MRTNLFPEVIGYILLLIGGIVLYISTLYTSSIIALIGLGLTFWGALFLFVKPEKYSKTKLLLSTTFSSLTFIDQVLSDLGYHGKAVYLPPEYSTSPKSGTVFISSKNDLVIPSSEELAENKVFLKKPKGICFTPPGLGLANLYEKELGKFFNSVDLNYLQKTLPKLLVENLELAKKVDIKIERDVVTVKITGSVYTKLFKEATELSNIYNSLGCPVCGSVAIALTRVTGKCLVVENTEVRDDEESFESCYRTVGKAKKQTGTQLGKASVSKFNKSFGLVSVGLGSIILAWVSGLIWNDITIWNKDFISSILDSRVGEAISLGIDVRVIHYLLIGSILLLIGVFLFLRKTEFKEMLYRMR